MLDSRIETQRVCVRACGVMGSVCWSVPFFEWSSIVCVFGDEEVCLVVESMCVG